MQLFFAFSSFFLTAIASILIKGVFGFDRRFAAYFELFQTQPFLAFRGDGFYFVQVNIAEILWFLEVLIRPEMLSGLLKRMIPYI